MHPREAKFHANRIPAEQVIPGRAYLISARNGNIGIARKVTFQGKEVLEYRLSRTKWGNNYLDEEFDWDAGTPYDTCIPLQLLDDIPPVEEENQLEWLNEIAEKYREEIEKIELAEWG